MLKKPASLDSQVAAIVAVGEALLVKPAKKKQAPRSVFRTPDQRVLNLTRFPKMDQAVLRHVHGEVLEKNVRTAANAKGKSSKLKLARVTTYDPENPLPFPLLPGSKSPLCAQCKLFSGDCSYPFLLPVGSENPVVTVIAEAPSREDDSAGAFNPEKTAIYAVIKKQVAEHSITFGAADVRWLLLTRCFNKDAKKPVNFRIKGNWCRWHIVDDLNRTRPKLVIAVGTAALGALSYKSNAQDWSGKTLTYRGWPDDWLTDANYALPQMNPLGTEFPKTTGHPVFGPMPEWRVPLFALQSPRLVFMDNNPVTARRWWDQVGEALSLAENGVKPKQYRRAWYDFTEDVSRIGAVLDELLSTPGILLAYDTETNGLRPWNIESAPVVPASEQKTNPVPVTPAKIVSIMLRWIDPRTHNARSIGFPWEVEDSPVYKALPTLKWKVWEVLRQSTLVGHNITFDVLYTYATFWKGHLTGWDDRAANLVRDAHLSNLTDAAVYDTWHMAYTTAQRRESLGLEMLAYSYVPDLAGYEEDMTLLIELNRDKMHPAANKGGHYLNCPREQWHTHLEPYVMGDVEVTYRAHAQLVDKLAATKCYRIPLAAPGQSGYFRWFTPPRRDWVYTNIMSPAARVLMTMMGRGMYVDTEEVARLETHLPKLIKGMREKFVEEDPRIGAWMGQCNKDAQQEARDAGKPVGEDDVLWHLDLENKEHLRQLLFDALGIVPVRLTKGGRKRYGDDVVTQREMMTAEFIKFNKESTPEQVADGVDKMLRKYTAIDKFTLNALAVEHVSLRSMLEYRKTYKLYTTYVRPLRNYTNTIVDKKERKKDPHLCYDDCIHASFMLTGTRGGRLSCRDPNLQQLPRDGEVKSMFVSRFGDRGCMYQADLSQIELRLMAAACGDPTMVKAYFDKEDLHSLTTSRIFNVPLEHFSKDYALFLQKNKRDKEAKQLGENRQVGKTVNFLTGYGGGAFGLQNVLAAKGIFKDLEECEDIIRAFFDSYPSLRAWLQLYKGFIQQRHCALSIFGRVRVFEEVSGSDEEAKAKALRAGCNHVIQSTASDMMLIALFVIEQEMRSAGLESLLVSTVHDSLLIDAIREELSRVHEIVSYTLNNFNLVLPAVLGQDFDTSWMLVPFAGDCDVGLDYLHVRKIPETNVDWDKLLAPSEAA